jgi:orotate phosphoribosyltransferase
MEGYKQSFIEFMVSAEVLTFGDFTAKSGRKTPYFVNAGKYRTGQQMRQLAGYYADAIVGQNLQFDVLFGPAYKGIPLAVAIAMTLAERGLDVPFCFDRKEAKDHGEGGKLVGHTPTDGEAVLIVEDVTTAGTSIRDTVPLLTKSGNVGLAGLVVSVDRMERGTTELNALDELAKQFNMRTFAIVTIDEVMQYLHNRTLNGRVLIDDTMYAKMQAYRAEYGGVAAAK